MKRFIAGLLMSGLMIPQLGAIVPPSCFNDSHDITSLTSWGPYSKRYAGISHIPDIKKGIRFDFSVMPCLLYTSPSPRDPKTSRMPSSA